MEVLLIFALLISPASHSQELRRLEKRAAGYDQHLAELKEAELRRLAQAEKQREIRKKQSLRYENIRDSFVRPTFTRDSKLEAAYIEKMEKRAVEELEKQSAYAKQRRQVLNEVDERNATLKPREYNLKGDEQ